MIHIICVGKLKSAWQQLAQDYAVRLSRTDKLTVTELPDQPAAAGQTARAIQQESAAILQALPKGAYVVLLDVAGAMPDSVGLSQRLAGWRGMGRPVAFVIGGSNGVSLEVQAHANEKISLSRLTFPHACARVLLLEQLYRAACILNHHPYHK